MNRSQKGLLFMLFGFCWPWHNAQLHCSHKELWICKVLWPFQWNNDSHNIRLETDWCIKWSEPSIVWKISHSHIKTFAYETLWSNCVKKKKKKRPASWEVKEGLNQRSVVNTCCTKVKYVHVCFLRFFPSSRLQCYCSFVRSNSLFARAMPRRGDSRWQRHCSVETRYQYKQSSSPSSACAIACVTFQRRACRCCLPAVVLLLVLFKEISYE